MSAPGWLLRVLGALPAPFKPAATQPPRALSAERVSSFLSARDYRFTVDEDGDLTGTWDGHRFWFLLLGDAKEIVQVRGRWSRTVPVEQRRSAVLAVNDWNRERIWPKAYLREEAGSIALYSEVSADLEPGVTDAQLDQILSCGLGTGVQLFAALDALLPGDGPPPDDIPDN